MTKYYLTNPQDSRYRLVEKGKTGSQPVYYCYATNTAFLLTNYMHKLEQRLLVEFDVKTGEKVPSQIWPVPSDWQGEPEAIMVDQSTWARAQQNDSFEKTLIAIVNNGDELFLVDDQNRMVNRIAVKSERLALSPIDSNGQHIVQ